MQRVFNYKKKKNFSAALHTFICDYNPVKLSPMHTFLFYSTHFITPYFL